MSGGCPPTSANSSVFDQGFAMPENVDREAQDSGRQPNSASGARSMGLLQCPCCDYFTLEERRSWNICDVCYWQDDGHDLYSLDEPSAVTTV